MSFQEEVLDKPCEQTETVSPTTTVEIMTCYIYIGRFKQNAPNCVRPERRMQTLLERHLLASYRRPWTVDDSDITSCFFNTPGLTLVEKRCLHQPFPSQKARKVWRLRRKIFVHFFFCTGRIQVPKACPLISVLLLH